MRPRTMAILALSLAGAFLLAPLAAAQSSSSVSSSSGSSASSSSSIGSSNVLGALALGAGGRSSSEMREAVALLASVPFLADDPCVAGARERSDGQLAATRMRVNDETLARLGVALVLGNGTLTSEGLAASFQGERTRLAWVDCADDRGTPISEVIWGPCLERGRHCGVALVLRLVLDADDLSTAEKAAALSAYI